MDKVLNGIKVNQDHIFCPRCGNSTHAESKCDFCKEAELTSEFMIVRHLNELINPKPVKEVKELKEAVWEETEELVCDDCDFVGTSLSPARST